MDIRQWLEGTADVAPLDRSDDVNIPEKFRHDRPEPDQVGRGYRYKRKRASSDSSIIAPKQSHRYAQAPMWAPSPDHIPQAEGTGRGSCRKDGSRASSSSHHDAPVETYERRARRKTRPDRYEPKVKKQKRARDTRKEKKNSQKRRRSHRFDDGVRTTGLVQSFQLKNGPKNNRLTLKPDTSAGLFKHGRASAQMAGRGGGLPDLTFNEMRFLQKPTEHQDDLQGADESHKSRTKDQRLDHGEEISAYFNAKAAITTERPETHNDRRKQSRRNDELPARSKRSQEADHSKPFVELPERPFLGFGSKGARPLSNGTNNKSTIYYTWSDTVHRPSSPPSKRQIEMPAGTIEPNRRWRRDDSLRQSRGENETAHAKTGVAQPVQNSNRDVGHGTWIRTGRGSGPALVEVYQPRNPRKQKRRDNTPVIQTTSQSLPRHPSSPPHFYERRSNDAVADPREQRSYHTSDILRVRDAPTEDAYTSPQCHLLPPHIDQDKENRDPDSSLSIDNAIRKARAAVQTPHFIPQAPVKAQKTDVASLPNIRRMHPINDLPKMRQLDAAHQTQTRVVVSPQFDFSRPAQAPRQSHLHCRPLSEAERMHWETTTMETLASRTPQMNHVRAPSYMNEDEEILHNTAQGEPANVLNNNPSMSSRYEDSVPHDWRFTPRSSIFEAQLNISGHHPSVSVFSEHEFLDAGPVRGLSIGSELHSERPISHQADYIDEALKGFWKPNRLY